MKDQIIIKDWTGKILFKGHVLHDGKKIDAVLEVNRCKPCKKYQAKNDSLNSKCKICDGSGYSGDFSVEWVDKSNEENVYECINY